MIEIQVTNIFSHLFDLPQRPADTAGDKKGQNQAQDQAGHDKNLGDEGGLVAHLPQLFHLLVDHRLAQANQLFEGGSQLINCGFAVFGGDGTGGEGAGGGWAACLFIDC